MSFRRLPPRLTRRQVMAGAAAAASASLANPAGAIGKSLDPRPTISSISIGSVRGVTGAVAAPRRFVLVGVQWSSPEAARIELRTRARGGEWGAWVLASVRGHEPDGPADRSAFFGEPIWTGPADFVELRSSGPVRGAGVHFVGPANAQATIASATFPLAQPVLEAGPGQPPIIARAAWAQGQARPRVAAHYGTVKLAFVHHSETPNGYGAGEVPAILRSIFDYHVFVRGFFDIAYNFAIDAYGRIWEARAGGIDEPVVGAQAGGYNQESTGAVVLGSYMDVVPSAAAIAALERLLAWKLSLHGIPTHGRVTVVVNPSDAFYTPFAPGAHVSLPRVAGHRDGDSTDCPGDAFYARLPAIRPRITALAGVPASLRIRTASSALAGGTVRVSGTLRRLGGGPLAGAPIEVQRVADGGTIILASATSAADGSWSTEIALLHNALLRALHRPSPAAVSEVVPIGVAPVITLSLDSLSPLRLSGTVVPARRVVTVELYRARKLGGHPLRRRRVAVQGGRFAVELGPLPPGSYVLVARTTADAGNIAGASTPLTVAVQPAGMPT